MIQWQTRADLLQVRKAVTNMEKNINPILEIKHLVKFFGEREILKDIDFNTYKGDVICIIGASGSGKSTLLRCINMLETPTSGDIIFKGVNINHSNQSIPLYRTKVGMVFQQFNLFNNMTVLENCMVGPIEVLKQDKEIVRKNALYYLNKVGMAQYSNAKPHQLSGGQRQRVAIARALAIEPQILLFDEPTSALDPELVGEVLKVIRELAEEKITMLIVTHEMKFAREISDRIIFMEKGEIIESAHPKKLFENPDHPRIIEFLKKMI